MVKAAKIWRMVPMIVGAEMVVGLGSSEGLRKRGSAPATAAMVTMSQEVR